MSKKIILFLTVLFFYFSLENTIFAETQLPKLFLFVGFHQNIHLSSYQKILSNPAISGVQVVYTWKELEPYKNKYDFSKIKKDIAYLALFHKKLFIQLQDRSFQPDLIYVPDYIRTEKIYHGGVAKQLDFPGESQPIAEGWVARVWDSAVRARFQALIKKLALEVDGQIAGMNLPETAIDVDLKHPPTNFSPDTYFFGELENIGAARKAFHHSIIIQYVNYFPGEWNNDHRYMERLFSYAIKNNIGLGGPDVVPYRKGQMKNSYPFFHRYHSELCEVGMAIQEGDYTYRDPVTHKYYHFADFYAFAKNYLGASILFWNVREPFFSKELMPMLDRKYFK